MISKDSARKVAQILFPQLWQTSPVEAIAKAIEFLHEAAGGLDTNSQHGMEQSSPVNEVVKRLADQIYHRKMHVNTVARSLGVSTYTVRTWLEGKYTPNDDNTAKITKFLDNLQATPEILKPEQ